MKITIITVVKNRVNEIADTIDSVLSQKFKNLEYIVYDANSTDGTSEIIKKYQNSILYFRENDNGMYDALNKAYNKATGTIIGHLHAGDVFYETFCLQNINELFLNKNIDWLSGDLEFINIKKKNVTRKWKYPIKNINIYNIYKVAHTTMFFKKEILKKLGNYDLNYRIAADTDFLIRLSKMNYNYFYFNQFILKMSNKGLSTSWKTLVKKIKEDVKIYIKYYSYFGVILYVRKILFKIPGIIFK